MNKDEMSKYAEAYNGWEDSGYSMSSFHFIEVQLAYLDLNDDELAFAFDQRRILREWQTAGAAP